MKPIFKEEQSSSRQFSVTLWGSVSTGFCFPIERGPFVQQSGATVWAAPTDRQAPPEVCLLTLRNHHKGWASQGSLYSRPAVISDGNGREHWVDQNSCERHTFWRQRFQGCSVEPLYLGTERRSACGWRIQKEDGERSPGLYFWNLDSCKVRHYIKYLPLFF